MTETTFWLQVFDATDDSPYEIRSQEKEVVYASLRPKSSESDSRETDEMNPYASVNKVVGEEGPLYRNLQENAPSGSALEIQLTCGRLEVSEEESGGRYSPSPPIETSLTVL